LLARLESAGCLDCWGLHYAIDAIKDALGTEPQRHYVEEVDRQCRVIVASIYVSGLGEKLADEMRAEKSRDHRVTEDERKL
jgi:hypothetical protein